MKLYTAIIKEIREVDKFSAYNITKNLRDKVNSGSIVIDDVDDIVVGVEDVANIEHESVNSIIKDIYDNQVMSLDRTQGPGYFIYEYDALIRPRIIASGQVTLGRALTAKLVPSSKFTILTGFSKSERHKIYTKVASYCSNKRKNKEIITIKGISSALKTKGITVDDLFAVCTKLNYQVVNKTPKSLSIVK